MLYLITQIAVCLLFTAAIGLIGGWLLRGLLAREQVQALESSWASQVAGLRRERDQLATQSQQLAQRMEQASADQAHTGQVLEQLHARVADAGEPGLDALRERVGELERAAGVQARRLADGERELAGREAQIAALERELTRALEDDERHIAEREAARARITQLEAQLECFADAAPSPRRASLGTAPEGLWSSPPPRVDRLQEISGIGPVLEGVLNRIGIYQFRQIARLSPENVEWVAAHLDWFPQRIFSDDWVGQARKLHNERYPREAL